MSNVPVRNKINGSKTSRVNVIQRTTSETLRLTDINCNNKGRTIAMSNQQPRKKPTGSFQVTGVSVISGDAGDDSTDDLDESRTDEASFSDDTVSRETDEAHQTQTLSTFPSSISVPSPIVSSNTSVATTSSTETAEAPSVSASPSKHFSDRFKVVKVESMVPFCRGRWTCMDYLDHSVHTPKDAYVYCQHQQQYVKASSVQMCDQSLQTPSVPSICQDPSTSASSCSILQQSVSQQIPAQALPLQQNNEMLLIVQDNRQNSDSVAQTPIQTRVQMQDVQQPIEMVVLKEEQVSADIAVTHLQQNLVAQNVYQQINAGNVYTPCTYPAYQSLPAFYNQPCQGVFPQMDFHPTSFQCDLPWLIYSGMNSPIGVRYVPPPTPQIPQSLTFFTPMPDEYATTYQRTSQNSVPPLENDQSAAKNRPLKTERKAETITAPFTTRENYMSVATTLPAQAQSMGHTYSVTGMIDNGDKENPITPPQQVVSNAQPAKPQVTETPACRPTNVTSTSNNNDIGVPPTQTNKTCVAEANANNNATAVSYQITKSSASSDDTESVSAGSAVAIDNKIAQAMDLVKSHLMYAVREEVDVLKERISELLDRINQLEVENSFLRANVPAEVLSALNDRPDESQDGEGPKKSSPPNNTQGGSN